MIKKKKKKQKKNKYKNKIFFYILLQDPHGELTNQNVLIVYGTLEETAEYFGFSIENTKAYLKEALDILYEARKQRPRPHLDDKIVTAWNGNRYFVFC